MNQITENDLALVRDAARAEVYAYVLSEFLTKTHRPAQAGDLRQVQERLSNLLDNIPPPDLPQIRNRLGDLAPKLEELLLEAPSLDYQMRQGIAATITFARMHAKGVSVPPVKAPQPQPPPLPGSPGSTGKSLGR